MESELQLDNKSLAIEENNYKDEKFENYND